MRNNIDLETEQALIAGLLADSSRISDVLDILPLDDFGLARHRDIVAAISDLQQRSEPVDVVAVAQSLLETGRCHSNDIDYLSSLIDNAGSGANVLAYAKSLRDFARRRDLLSVLDACATAMRDDYQSSTDELIARAASLIGGLQCSDGEGIRNTRQILKSLAEKWNRRAEMNGEIDGLATGIERLDERFCGWKPGDLVVIAGRPSMGKSVLSFQIALHATVGLHKRAAVFSLEMTAEQLMERATASVGKIPLDVFRRCDKNRIGEYQSQILSAGNRLKLADLLVDDTPQLHINQIIARARNAHRKSPLSLVVVDHIHIVRADGQSRERELAAISGGLKALAKELGCPVVAVTQLNRGVEQRPNKRPLMSDLRDSGSIEQDADIVLLLYRDEYYDQDSKSKGVIEIATGKFREGETGTDYCASLLHMSRIDNLSYDYALPKDEEPKKIKNFSDYQGKRYGD